MRFKLLTLIGALALITGGTPVSAVFRAKRRTPFDEGVLAVHRRTRFLLHVYKIEPRGDQARLEGFL